MIKKKDITKKNISCHISFDFLGQNPDILSAKRLPQTAKNGVQKKRNFFEWTFSKLVVSLVGYFRKKSHEIFVLQKICKKWSVPVEIQQKKSGCGTTFLLILGKKTRDHCKFHLMKSTRITCGWTIGKWKTLIIRRIMSTLALK